jgi:hypothetical protein
MGQCKIFVSENYVASLRTVYHEILHAVYRVPHISGCPLMGPVHCEISEEEADRLFCGVCPQIFEVGPIVCIEAIREICISEAFGMVRYNPLRFHSARPGKTPGERE